MLNKIKKLCALIDESLYVKMKNNEENRMSIKIYCEKLILSESLF